MVFLVWDGEAPISNNVLHWRSKINKWMENRLLKQKRFKQWGKTQIFVPLEQANYKEFSSQKRSEKAGGKLIVGCLNKFSSLWIPLSSWCSPWHNRNGWLGVKHQVIYLLTPRGDCFIIPLWGGLKKHGISIIYNLFDLLSIQSRWSVSGCEEPSLNNEGADH